jgi:hypothetical protein
MKSQKEKRRAMPKFHLNHLPTVQLGFNDLATVRSIIRAYITYTRRVSQPTRAREEQIQLLESLYLRMASIPVNVADMAILLSVADIVALDCAIAGFCAFVRNKVPPSQERDETLQDVERLRQDLARML